MKKFLVAAFAASILLGAPALAADLPVKAPAIAPAPTVTWSGCYLGANAGWGWSKQTFIDPPTDEVFNRFTADGAVAGGQLGCDVQSGPWVWGVQALLDWTNIHGSGLEFPCTVCSTDEARVRWFGTVTGRVGYALQPDALLYVKGGAAWARTHYTDSPPESFANGTHVGWTVGAGWEKIIAPNWSLFIEYDYANLGRHQYSFAPGVTFVTDIRENLQSVMVGLNYRFGTYGKAPVVAKY